MDYLRVVGLKMEQARGVTVLRDSVLLITSPGRLDAFGG